MLAVPIFPALCCIEIHIFQASSHFTVGFLMKYQQHTVIFPRCSYHFHMFDKRDLITETITTSLRQKYY